MMPEFQCCCWTGPGKGEVMWCQREGQPGRETEECTTSSSGLGDRAGGGDLVGFVVVMPARSGGVVCSASS